MIIQKCREFNKPLFTCFVDLYTIKKKLAYMLVSKQFLQVCQISNKIGGGDCTVCAVAVSSPERGSGQSIGDSTSRMQPEQCPCGDVHPPDRLRHIEVYCQGTQR